LFDLQQFKHVLGPYLLELLLLIFWLSAVAEVVDPVMPVEVAQVD
jgi:hypothetical protein